MSKIYYIVYETINLVNNKKYRGVHTTTSIDDGYLGSGTALRRAVKKYGKSNFIRNILFFAFNENILYDVEKIFVDENWISREDTYNISLGGSGTRASNRQPQKPIKATNIFTSEQITFDNVTSAAIWLHQNRSSKNTSIYQFQSGINRCLRKAVESYYDWAFQYIDDDSTPKKLSTLYAWDFSGKLVGSFKGFQDAANVMYGSSPYAITSAKVRLNKLLNKHPVAYYKKYLWSKNSNFDKDAAQKVLPKRHYSGVTCVETGQSFGSYKEAADFFNKSPSYIRDCITHNYKIVTDDGVKLSFIPNKSQFVLD